MIAQYTLRSENGTRDVLSYLRFAPHTERRGEGYDCHLSPEITHFIGTRGMMEIDGKEYEICPGDIFILHSNEKHRVTRVDVQGEIENLRFDPAFIWQGNDVFDLNYLRIFDPQRSGVGNRLERTCPAMDTVRNCLAEIRRELELSQYGCRHMVKMQVFILLITLLRDFGNFPPAGESLRTPNVEGVRATMRYIDEHLEEVLSLPELAAMAGLSTNYYGTLFKQLNGITPVEYITSRRVLRAIELLPEFDGTMLQLALACGFNNTANFNRAFRAYTGQTPSKYTPPIR